MDKDEALKMALVALNTPRPCDSYPPLWYAYRKAKKDAINAVEAALAAPAHELVGYMSQARCFVHKHEVTEAEAQFYGWTPVYTPPTAPTK